MSTSNKQCDVGVIMNLNDGQPDAHMPFNFQLIYMYFLFFMENNSTTNKETYRLNVTRTHNTQQPSPGLWALLFLVTPLKIDDTSFILLNIYFLRFIESMLIDSYHHTSSSSKHWNAEYNQRQLCKQLIKCCLNPDSRCIHKLCWWRFKFQSW